MWGILKRKKSGIEIQPEEVLLDRENRLKFNPTRFEGRLERPLGSMPGLLTFLGFCVVMVVFITRLTHVQFVQGDELREKSENNHLAHEIVFAQRGTIEDRNGVPLAWNQPVEERPFPNRSYVDLPGFDHILGYVRYPKKDPNGYYYATEFTGVSGIEAVADDRLKGKNGKKIVEENATGGHISESSIDSALPGETITLTIDSRVQTEFHEAMRRLSEKAGFTGGGGVILDIKTGEILAITSFPEATAFEMSEDPSLEDLDPLLNRATAGLYTPGSIVKPFVAFAALNEGVVDVGTKILSTKTISIPNPYFPDKPTVFSDWEAHGPVDVREALAHSSNVYFYNVGGGYRSQEGVGIRQIERYMKAFGVGEKIGIKGFSATEGVIPTPEWKEKYFEDGTWRLGDTYNTSIGQYGFQVTPLQMARADAAIANKGTLVTPFIIKGENPKSEKVSIDIPGYMYDAVQEGMNMTTTVGTAKVLRIPGVTIAAKTGTAELGYSKELVNSWVTGFFPYQNPKYAFAVVMERAPRSNIWGATWVMRDTLEWMRDNTPEYITP